MRIGVLALQGAFAEHIQALEELNVVGIEIRKRADFTNDLDGLIIPGGESTVIGKLMTEEGLIEPVRKAIQSGMPVFGTCAGAILLAKEVSGSETSYLNCIDMKILRNAYGRQLGSFTVTSDFKGVGKFPMVFIRAPYMEEVYGDAEVLACVDDKVVAVRQKHMLAAAFHPELTQDRRIHNYFCEMCREYSYSI